MASHPKHIAVITGDLVNSTELGPDKISRAFMSLEQCADDLAGWHGRPLHFTRHRGDGWQVALAQPKMTLRSALAFRAALRANGDEFDSYMGIAEGTVPDEVGPDLNAETARVFALSGTNLEMVRENNSGPKIVLGPDLQKGATAILADHISSRWTPTQAEAALIALKPGKRVNTTAMAKTLGKSRQAIAKSLLAASVPQILHALTLMEGDMDA